MEITTLIPTAEQAQKRIDTFIAEELEVSRSTVQNWLEQGLVSVDGAIAAKNLRIKEGVPVLVTVPEPVACEITPENIPLSIVYEDEDLLVVDKPKGLVVHPAAGHYQGTLVNALLWHCGESLSGINGVMRPGIVHRIDKDTSGLLIVAKNDLAHQGLAEQIKEHSFTRIYEAVICGHLKQANGIVDAPIGRHPVQRKKMAVTAQNSKHAVTHYTVLAEYPGYSHVRLKLETGRTHQIRVHMSYLGHPVAGDTVYGAKAQKGFEGQCLHARTIGFIHPRTGEYLEFTGDLPAYFTEFLSQIQQ